ncbi:MAG: prefoldin subunit beta [Desulfurococcales archaeon]|nr:prefoldin subunit beta [Desulfurococcales archaeon]
MLVLVEKVPPDVEAKYNKYVQLRETLNAVVQERLNVEGTIAEIDSIVEKLRDLPENAELYRMFGYVLVKSTRDEVLNELNEKKEDLELRLKALKSQEESLKREIEKLGEELKRLLSGRMGATGIGG